MGLLLPFSSTSETGISITANNSYWRILNFSGSKDKIFFSVACFYNREARKDNKSPLKEESFDYVPDLNSEDNFIKQAYKYLKTLDEFKNAVDVLEEGQTA